MPFSSCLVIVEKELIVEKAVIKYSRNDTFEKHLTITATEVVLI